MIEKPTRNVYTHDLIHHLKNNCNLDIAKMSGEETLNELFGSRSDRGSFQAIDIFWEPRVKRIHRFNRLWVYPMTLILSPFRYVLYGHPGFEDSSKIGRWILKITGYR